jgi:hypothetical protein
LVAVCHQAQLAEDLCGGLEGDGPLAHPAGPRHGQDQVVR